MRKIVIYTLLFITSEFSLFGQALPIGVDGRFNDWKEASSVFNDTENDGVDYDLLSFSVSNDSAYLFIKIALSEEIELDDNNKLYLYIDTDDNPATGYFVNEIGSELRINFGGRKAYFVNGTTTTTVYQNDIRLIALPTVTSDTFEITIGRHVKPDGINDLFTNPTIKLCFIDTNSGGDSMPNSGTSFSYTFDETNVGTYDDIDFAKKNSTDIRLMTYNTLYDGLYSDPNRVNAFKRIITAVKPDIITFNECWDHQDYDYRQLLDAWIPLPNNAKWNCKELDNGNVTCSKYNFISHYNILFITNDYKPRNFASLIDLPSTYPRDLLIINSHFKASSGITNDLIRQDEADATIKFIKDVKSPGGLITLPYGTPFVISGDLNLVTYSQQLTTLLTGDIVDNATFGSDEAPDWDKSDLNDVISFQTDSRVAYTQGNSQSGYWPGRLDFAICSDIGLTVNKAFTVNTQNMSVERLLTYGLLATDSELASDHLPKVTDFIINNDAQSVDNIKNLNNIIYPNPSPSGFYTISNNQNKIKSIEVTDLTGRVIKTVDSINHREYKLDLTNLKSGIYFLRVSSENEEQSLKIIK